MPQERVKCRYCGKEMSRGGLWSHEHKACPKRPGAEASPDLPHTPPGTPKAATKPRAPHTGNGHAPKSIAKAISDRQEKIAQLRREVEALELAVELLAVELLGR